MGTKLNEMRNGCFAKALDDEPMFVLLARDPAAPALVREWAGQRRAAIELGRRPSSDLAQVEEAEQCATNMEAWRKEHDGEWRKGLFTDDECEGAPARNVQIPDGHSVRQEGDEYACSCGTRWDVSEGEEHP